MALIKTQRALRQAINDTKKIITDIQLFLSESYYAFLDAMIAGVTKRYEQPVKIELAFEDENIPAYTDGNLIHVNVESKGIKDLTRKDKHKAIIASVLHECGHILFTDFRLNEVTMQKLQKENMLYPMPKSSELSEYVSMWLIRNNAGPMLSSLYHHLDNCVEDGHVDNRIIKHIPGYGECRTWYKTLLAAELPTYEVMKADKQLDNIAIMLNLILSYAKFGAILYEEKSAKDELIQKIYEIKLLIDEAVKENNSVERKRTVNEIFVHIFSVIEEEIKKQQNQQNQQQQSSNSSQNASQNASDGSNSSQNDSGDENNQNGKNDAKNGNNGDQRQQNNGSDSKDGSNTQGNSQNSQGDNGQSSQNGSTQNSSSANSQGPIDSSSLQQALNQAMSTMSSALSKNDNVHKNTQSLKSPANDKDNSSSQSTGSDDASSKTDAGDNGLEQLLSGAAQEQVAKEQESELKRELSSQLSEVAKNNHIHRNVRSTMKRQQVTSSGKTAYEQFHEELDSIAKRLTRNLEKEIRERKIGDTLNGLYMGKRLDNKGLHRQDMKIFTKKIQPENIPDMEVSLLIDLSGSMSGKRINRATETAYVMYQFCQQLHIPVSVYGHHVLGSSVEVVSYTDGISLDHKDGIRIFEMEASGCNRDGYALRFCLEKLKKSDAQTRLMFVISDGRPNDTGYGMAEGKADIQDAVANARKAGIITVTAAIGNDTNSVRAIYTEGVSEKRSAIFLDITELDKLPKTFPKIIKRYLY